MITKKEAPGYSFGASVINLQTYLLILVLIIISVAPNIIYQDDSKPRTSSCCQPKAYVQGSRKLSKVHHGIPCKRPQKLKNTRPWGVQPRKGEN